MLLCQEQSYIIMKGDMVRPLLPCVPKIYSILISIFGAMTSLVFAYHFVCVPPFSKSCTIGVEQYVVFMWYQQGTSDQCQIKWKMESELSVVKG